MKFNGDYREYNKVTISLGNYIVSNIYLGDESSNCQAHLTSITIEPPSAGAVENPQGTGTKGKISLIDYKNAVINYLTGHLENYIDTNKDSIKVDTLNTPPQDMLPQMTIEIQCFTGTTKLDVWVIGWETSFVGTTPNVNLTWTCVPQGNSSNNNPTPQPNNQRFTKVSEAINTFITALNPTTSFGVQYRDENDKTYDLNTIDSKLKFTEGYCNIDLNKTNGNNAFDTFLSYLVGYISDTNDNTVYYETGAGVYTILPHGVRESASNGEIDTKQLIFMQNSGYPAYSQVDGKYIIPVDNFNYSIDFEKMGLKIYTQNNPNGSTISDSTGNSTQVSSAQSATNAVKSQKVTSDTAPVTVSFDCWNVMSFSRYNVKSPIEFRIYDEFGNEHAMSKEGHRAIVQKVTYTLDGAVIKASVEATKVFNGIGVEEDGGGSVEGENGKAGSPAGSSGGSGSNGSGSSSSGGSGSGSKGTISSSYTVKEYLCSEDAVKTPLDNDKTLSLLGENGVFRKDVLHFLNNYGSKTGTDKLLDISFIEQLISHGNYGLLALLLAVANWGISNPPKSFGDDIVCRLSDFTKSKPFCASHYGKHPFDRLEGGLGIAHWDAQNYINIYKICGFDPSIDKTHMQNLIVGIPKKEEAIKKYTGSFSSWGTTTFNGIQRISPIFKDERHCYMREFKDGLKKDEQWQDWAKKILNYRDDSGNFIYQYYLFELWVEKFWKPTLEALNKNSTQRTPTIQDAIRISRAGNSKTSLISMSAGKNAADQYAIYDGDKDRAVRQKSFCRRCADIVGWINSSSAPACTPVPASTPSSPAKQTASADEICKALGIEIKSLDLEYYHGNKFKSPPKWIIVHYTAGAGTKAKRLCKIFAGSRKKDKVSSHFGVDENDIYSIVSLEYTAAHIGSGACVSPRGKSLSLKQLASYECDDWRYNLAATNHLMCIDAGDNFLGNSMSIGVDMCVEKTAKGTGKATDTDWYFKDETVDNTAKLLAYLMKRFNIDINHVRRHADFTGKLCPQPFCYPFDVGDKRWEDFKAQVSYYRNNLDSIL